MKKTIKLLPAFVMTKEEIEQYNNLPDNMPDTKLTNKQLEFVSILYHKYISKIDNMDWSPSLVSMEMREKWPSGPRMKLHQAQRIVLNNLVNENERKTMTQGKAMMHFFTAMTCRPAYVRLVSKIWDI